MRIENRVQIDAPVDVVWAATEDVGAWPKWTPTVTSAEPLTEGPMGVGSGYRLKQPLQPMAIWEVTSCEKGRYFTWRKRGAFIRFEASHHLEPSGDGTRNTLILEARGVGALLRYPVLRPAVTHALAQENAGLKAFCEGCRAADRRG